MFLVGQHMKVLVDLISKEYSGIHVSYFNDKDALKRALISNLHYGDIILVKGSNSSGMADIVKHMKALDQDQDMQAIGSR